MKKLLVLALLLCTPALYAAQYARCQYEDESLRYGLHTNTTRVEFFGGVALPDKEWHENGQKLEIGDTGFTAGIAFVRNIMPWLTLGLDGNYTGFSKGEDFTTTGGNLVNYRSGVGTGLITTRAYLFPKSMTRLYGTAGLGAGYMYAREKNKATDSSETYDSLDFAWMLGAGLEFDIDESVVFGAEGRYNWVGLRSDMKSRFNEDEYKYWTIMLKLGVKF
ncbi:MAG: porin family protein [Elusimicrobiaceae bacterium]|nr:porin family protein [Elusimicrobiaceae bacterium]